MREISPSHGKLNPPHKKPTAQGTHPAAGFSAILCTAAQDRNNLASIPYAAQRSTACVLGIPAAVLAAPKNAAAPAKLCFSCWKHSGKYSPTAGQCPRGKRLERNTVRSLPADVPAACPLPHAQAGFLRPAPAEIIPPFQCLSPCLARCPQALPCLPLTGS